MSFRATDSQGIAVSERESLLSRVAFDALPLAALLCDAEQTILLANRSAESLLGAGNEIPPGIRLASLLSAESAALLSAQWPQRELPSERSGKAAPLLLAAVTLKGRHITLSTQIDQSGYLLVTLAAAKPPLPQDEARHLDDARFRMMISSVRDYALLMLDPTGHVQSWNDGARRLKGYSDTDIIGQHFSRFYPPEDVAADKPGYELKHALLDGRFEDEGWRVRKDGTRFWANVIITPMRDESGTLIAFSKVTRDMTSRKSHEDSFRLMVEAAPSAMLMVDPKGSITIVNKQAEQLFGYLRAELLGQPVELLVPQRIRPKHPGLRDGFMSHPQPRSMGIGRDLFGVTKSGNEVPIEIGLNPIETPEGFFVLASIIDITERKRSANALAESNRAMAVQIAETQSALERLQETQNQLVQAEKLASLGGLVAGIAHEINTPVGNTFTAATLLQDEVGVLAGKFASGSLKRSDFETFVQGSVEAVRIIVTNTSRAANLIQSFKMIAVDQSSGEIRELEMLSYLNEVMLSLRPLLRRGQVEAIIDCPPELRVVTAPGELAQVITNLVSNAVLHAFEPNQPGELKLSVRVVGGNVELRCRDSGKGMNADVLGKIFDPFFTTRRGSGGSGLGMHIVYNIVEQTLGGRIAVHSAPGEGTEFVITFPQNHHQKKSQG